jgi:preprotein translocase subunit SecE
MAVESKAKGTNKKPKKDSGIIRYLKDVKAEFKKITWPTRDTVVKTTGIVIVTVVLFTLVLWGYDSVFGVILNKLLDVFN